MRKILASATMPVAAAVSIAPAVAAAAAAAVPAGVQVVPYSDSPNIVYHAG